MSQRERGNEKSHRVRPVALVWPYTTCLLVVGADLRLPVGRAISVITHLPTSHISLCIFQENFGCGDRLRSCDILGMNQALYWAELHRDIWHRELSPSSFVRPYILPLSHSESNRRPLRAYLAVPGLTLCRDTGANFGDTCPCPHSRHQ